MFQFYIANYFSPANKMELHRLPDTAFLLACSETGKRHRYQHVIYGI